MPSMKSPQCNGLVWPLYLGSDIATLSLIHIYFFYCINANNPGKKIGNGALIIYYFGVWGKVNRCGTPHTYGIPRNISGRKILRISSRKSSLYSFPEPERTQFRKLIL